MFGVTKVSGILRLGSVFFLSLKERGVIYLEDNINNKVMTWTKHMTRQNNKFIIDVSLETCHVTN